MFVVDRQKYTSMATLLCATESIFASDYKYNTVGYSLLVPTLIVFLIFENSAVTIVWLLLMFSIFLPRWILTVVHTWEDWVWLIRWLLIATLASPRHFTFGKGRRERWEGKPEVASFRTQMDSQGSRYNKRWTFRAILLDLVVRGKGRIGDSLTSIFQREHDDTR